MWNKLAFILFIPITYLMIKVLITLIKLFLIRLLWWITPFFIVVGICEYVTRIMLNASKETVTPSSSNQEIERTQLTTRQIKRRRRKEKRLLKSIERFTNLSQENVDQISNNTDLTFKNTLQCSVSYTHTFNTDENVTKIFSLKNQMSKYYAVNETIFSDVEIKMADEFCSYKLYKVMKTDRSSDVHTTDELTEDDLAEFLYMTVQTTKHGFIINNNVYLTRDKWHTLQQLDENVYSCAVCDLQCEGSNVSVHIESVRHIQNLSLHSPLKKCDLSIIRKINENLHCGVCNTVIPITMYNEHESSKSHEEHLLSSINKVSDVCEDFSGTTQNFDANNIRAPNNAPSRIEGIWSGFWSNEGSVSESGRVAENRVSESDRVESGRVSESDRVSEDRVSESDRVSEDRVSESDRMSESDRVSESGRVSESDRVSEARVSESDRVESRRVSESDDQTDISEDIPKVNEMDIFNEHFGRNLYKNIRIYEEEVDEYCLPIEGVSYASMASKPKLDVPNFLKIDLGTKEVRVKFEYWHMITPTNPKDLYCMVCTESFPLRHKRAHCLSELHVTALSKCAVVGAFEDYLIRDVSEKLYHCGHCNNLQYKNDMKIHVEKYHPMDSKRPLKLPSTDQNQNLAPVKIDQPMKIQEKPAERVKKIKIDQPMKHQEKPAESVKKLDIFGCFKFAPFGVEMIVSNLACHTLMVVLNRYYCAICDVYVQGELIKHVYERTHMQLINMTPFIRPFQCNLTRAVRGSLHCAVCNILVPVENIDNHNFSTYHTDLLARALGMVKNERPRQELKYHRDERTEFKTELDRFLATLPADTQDMLSRLKVKNPKGEMIDLTDSTSNFPKLKNSPPKADITKPLNYPKNGVEGSNFGVKLEVHPKNVGSCHPSQMIPQNVVKTCHPIQMIPQNVQRPFHPSQMIPLSVIEAKLRVESDRKDEVNQNIQMKRPDIENAQVKNGNDEKNVQSVGKVKVPDRKTETERKKSETEDSEDEDAPFVPDEMVLLKLKSAYFKVTSSAYHSLVPLGAGSRRCCACSIRLENRKMRAHIRVQSHLQTVIGHQWTGQLIRQMYHTYHCAFCNVTMSRTEVKMHLEWPPHVERYEAASKKLNKKDLKDMLKNAKEINLDPQKFTQKEHPEPIHIISYIQSTRDDYTDSYVEERCENKSQMIILEGKMMKISFESWHGLLLTKSGIKCVICQLELNTDLEQHLTTKYHRVALGMTFEKQYYPALIRKINQNTVNCVTCNLEIPNDDSLIHEHTNGRKHVKKHNTIIEKTSHTDSYSDCYKYPITL